MNKEYPTPTAKGDTCMKTKRYAQGGHPLTLVVGVEEEVIEPPEDYAWPRKQYPTPTTQETEHPQAELTETGRRKTGNGNSHSLNLADTIRTGVQHDHSFPTPGTTGFSNGSGNCEKANTLAKEGISTEEERVSFRAGNGGQLNPDWTEWLMDWPIGWTDLKAMSKESMADWLYRVSNCQWNENDPAELPKDHELYVGRLTEDRTHRADRLKAIGNGQVPLCVYFVTEILSTALIVMRDRA